MKAYIALTEKVFHFVEENGCLTHSLLGTHWLPMKESKEAAVYRAVQGTAISGMIAVEPMIFYVLEVALSGSQALAMFQEQKLVRVKKTQGWQWNCELTLNLYEHHWSKCTVPPMGIDAWADFTLAHDHIGKSSATCAQCGATGKTTWASHGQNSKDFCGPCWQKDKQERSQDRSRSRNRHRSSSL